MIQKLTAFEPYLDFINGFKDDPDFSDPAFETEEQIGQTLSNAINHPDQEALGVFCGSEMTGLFVFLIVEKDRYIEMLVGLSRCADAYEQITEYLTAHYPDYQVDFVFNPDNPVISEVLTRKGATFFERQIKMLKTQEVAPVDTAGIEPLSERYEDQYIAMHSTDGYWTGERVVKALDTFSVFLAVDGGTVAGYIDVTKNNEENEPFDLLVKEAFRKRGWGRKLLAKAIEENRPKRMMLIVDLDNEPAIALYRSMGFTVDPEKISRLATWFA